MTRRARRTHSPAFKAKVALVALKGERSGVSPARRHALSRHVGLGYNRGDAIDAGETRIGCYDGRGAAVHPGAALASHRNITPRTRETCTYLSVTPPPSLCWCW
jgi:hypothetical protein